MTESKQQSFDSGQYWIERHEAFDRSHQATGLAGSTERSNAVLYDLRTRALSEAIGMNDLRGRRVLDAGCGLGDFSRFYKERGAALSGCDISPLAAEKCNQAGLGVFKAGRLRDIPAIFPGETFDIVHCFDVLYHVVDDEEWKATLEAFAAVSTRDTVWYFVEVCRPRGAPPHIRPRTRTMYDQALAGVGQRIISERRIHWLLSVFPRLHAMAPGLSIPFERLAVWRPTRQLARAAVWTIGRAA